MKVLQVTAILGLGAVMSACGAASSTGQRGGNDPHAVQVMPAGPADCPGPSAAADMAVAAATSQARRARGLPAVRANPLLSRVAAEHACDMARRGHMTHIGSTTTGPAQRVKAAGYRPRLTAENIAAGPFSRDRVLAEWNASSGHLENILIPQVSEVGIGHAIGPDGRTAFWAAVYSVPR